MLQNCEKYISQTHISERNNFQIDEIIYISFKIYFTNEFTNESNIYSKATIRH